MPLLSEELQRPNRNICLREFRFDLFIKDHHIRFANVEYCVSFEGENLKVELSHDKTKHSNPCHARLSVYNSSSQKNPSLQVCIQLIELRTSKFPEAPNPSTFPRHFQSMTDTMYLKNYFQAINESLESMTSFTSATQVFF